MCYARAHQRNELVKLAYHSRRRRLGEGIFRFCIPHTHTNTVSHRGALNQTIQTLLAHDVHKTCDLNSMHTSIMHGSVKVKLLHKLRKTRMMVHIKRWRCGRSRPRKPKLKRVLFCFCFTMVSVIANLPNINICARKFTRLYALQLFMHARLESHIGVHRHGLQ